MTDYGTIMEPGTIRFERILPAPPETVWAFLVEPEKRARWLAGGKMDLRPDGTVELIFNNMKLSEPGDGPPEKYREHSGTSSMHGRIIACEPPKLLCYSWAEPGSIDAAQASEVTFELTPQGSRTLLVLTHRRLKPGEQMEGVAAGWHTHLDLLADHAGNRKPASFWQAFAANEAEYRARLAR